MPSFIEVNYEALRLKVEGRHQNLADKSNEQASDLNLCLSNDFCLIIKENLEETMVERLIGRLRLKEQHFDSVKHESRRPSTSLVDESDVFGRQNGIKDLTDHLLSKDANGVNLTVVSIIGMGGVGKTSLRILKSLVYGVYTVHRTFSTCLGDLKPANVLLDKGREILSTTLA